MQAYGGLEAQLHTFLTSALEVSGLVSRPGCFTSEEKHRGTHCTGGWVDSSRSTADVNVVVKRKIPPCRSRIPVIQTVAYVATTVTGFPCLQFWFGQQNI
jgi:hypothetical protein